MRPRAGVDAQAVTVVLAARLAVVAHVRALGLLGTTCGDAAASALAAQAPQASMWPHVVFALRGVLVQPLSGWKKIFKNNDPLRVTPNNGKYK